MSLGELRSLLITKPWFSNEILPDQEDSVVRGLLSNALEELDLIEREPWRSYNASPSLRERHKTALAQVKIYRIAIAPHKKLPTEILTEILILCMPASGATFPPDSKSAPWSTGRVCSSWRRIVVREPQIWRRVQFTYQYDLDIRERLHIFAHAMMLSLRHQLISLEASMSPKSDVTFTTFIMSHSSSLEGLSLSLCSTSTAPFLSLPPIQFKSLKCLTLRLLPDTRIQPGQITAFNNTPSLREVKIQTAPNYNIMFRFFPIELPWAQLKNLVLTCMEMAPSELCSLLDKCSALVSGFFRLIDERLSRETTSHIVVPALQTLILHLNSQSRSLKTLFSSLTLPALESFAIFGSGGTSWPHNEFCSFLYRSSCSLQSFKTGISIGDEGVESLLREIPTLRVLKLPLNQPISAKVIKNMMDESLTPELEVFHFGTTSINAALDLMEDRWSTDEVNERLPVGIWEAVIGWGTEVEDQTEGHSRYDMRAEGWLWDEERNIELRFVK